MKRSLSSYLQLAFTLLICAFMLVPVLMSVAAGLTNNYFQGLSSGLTLRWVEEVLALYSDTIWLTLQLALATLLINLIVGVPAAYYLASSNSRWARVFEELIVLPVAIPGLAIALALIIAYGGVHGLRTSWLFILIGHVLYTLPFMVRAVLAVLHSINFRTLEEGAASLGAGFFHKAKKIRHSWLGQRSVIGQKPLNVVTPGILNQGFVGTVCRDPLGQLTQSYPFSLIRSIGGEPGFSGLARIPGKIVTTSHANPRI